MNSPWTDDVMRGGRGPQMPPPPARSSGGGLSAALVALLVVIAAGILALTVSSLLRGGRSFWPDDWDPRVVPIAERAEQLRGLEFDHPVVVHFLPEQAFNRLASGGERVGSAERAEIARQAATFRALGFINGDVDLFEAAQQTGEAGVLAFYDFEKKQIVVRGTTLNVSRSATIAHELAHVLQDQHFDIRRIQRQASEDELRRGGSAGSMLALIEGDADRVSEAYLDGLSAEQRTQYDREQAAARGEFGEAIEGVPPFVRLLFSAPYEFGPFTIRMLVSGGGNASVNAALTGPTPTSADFVQAGLIAPPPPNLSAPKLADDEEAVGPPEAFGAFELYLVLATRGEAGNALTAADSVLGGRAQSLRRNGTDCYRARLATRSEPAAAFVAGSLQRWGESATNVSVVRDGSHVSFTACDPGRSAVGASKEQLDAAVSLLGARSGIAVSAAEAGLAPGRARCVARLFALSPGAIDTVIGVGNGSLPPEEGLRLREIVRQHTVTCTVNPSAGLL